MRSQAKRVTACAHASGVYLIAHHGDAARFKLEVSVMATAMWKGSLTFGLVAVPIRLYTAARSERLNLHQLHKECHTRLKQPLYCPHCNRQVERSEVVKGYEHEKGQYVIVTDEEL